MKSAGNEDILKGSLQVLHVHILLVAHRPCGEVRHRSRANGGQAGKRERFVPLDLPDFERSRSLSSDRLLSLRRGSRFTQEELVEGLLVTRQVVSQ